MGDCANISTPLRPLLPPLRLPPYDRSCSKGGHHSAPDSVNDGAVGRPAVTACLRATSPHASAPRRNSGGGRRDGNRLRYRARSFDPAARDAFGAPSRRCAPATPFPSTLRRASSPPLLSRRSPPTRHQYGRRPSHRLDLHFHFILPPLHPEERRSRPNSSSSRRSTIRHFPPRTGTGQGGGAGCGTSATVLRGGSGRVAE